MRKKLKALLLCAGYGTRLRPITLTKPKCLVEVSGIPLLERWLCELERIGVDEVLINTHYLADKIREFVDNWESNNLKVTLTYEKELLGTAGTLIKNKSFFKDSTCLFLHADNYTNYDMNLLLEAHEKRDKKCYITMLIFKSFEPEKCGVVELDSNNIVTCFHEKVINPPSDLASGAIFVFDYKFFNFLNLLKPRPKDFSKDVIPNLLGKIQSCYTSSVFIDIGTPENLKKANFLV